MIKDKTKVINCFMDLVDLASFLPSYFDQQGCGSHYDLPEKIINNYIRLIVKLNNHAFLTSINEDKRQNWRPSSLSE